MEQACRGSCPCCGIADLFLLRVQMGNRIIKSLQEAEEGSDPGEEDGAFRCNTGKRKYKESDLPVIMRSAQTFD